MKQINLRNFLLAVMLLFMIFLILCGITGCTSTKHIKKDTTSFDSSYFKNVLDSNYLLKKENTELKKTISNKEKSEIVFEDKICPPCPELPTIPDNLDLLNKDSVNRLIHDLNDLITFQNNYINNQDNTIRKYADGSIEYKGRIKSYSLANELLQDELRKKDEIIDYIKFSSKTDDVNVSKETTSTEKKTEKSLLNWWHFLIIGFITGGVVLVPLDRKTKIFKLFNI